MSKTSYESLPLVFLSSEETKRLISYEVKRGRVRKIAPRLYTKILQGSLEQVVKAHLWEIVALYFPDALISDRTALESAPAADGSIFLISNRKNRVELPGISIKPRKGVPPLASDRPFIGGLFLSSPARFCLENLEPSRSRDGAVSRTVSKAEFEAYCDRILRFSGEGELNRLREEARRIAPELSLEDQFVKLDRIIGALLGTKDETLLDPSAVARKHGQPYDPARIELFEVLRRELESTAPIIRQQKDHSQFTLPFFEAYFSNFIEGTEFEVAEAAQIVFEGKIPADRPADAHDILGTFRVVSDPSIMTARAPQNADELMLILKRCHAEIMSQRPEKNPGQFKSKNNQVGSTYFVEPELVVGTLRKGYEIFRSITTAFGRAVFALFFISEIHPFTDGNGRVARVIMNIELCRANQERIIIPSVYRNNYLSALRTLSGQSIPTALIRTLDFAQRFVATIDWSDLKVAQKMLEDCQAFLDPNEAEDRGVRLRLPIVYS
jgi:hypothetical protein